MRAVWLSILLLVGWLGGAGAADDDCSNASPAEARALVSKAAKQLRTLGHLPAFQNFMDPQGEFFPRDLYVFVVDLEGNMWVNGAFPQTIGTNALAAEDAKGRRYIAQIVRLAQAHDTGRIEYQWFNPCTGEYADKITFFVRVERFIVAVGAYGSITTRADPATNAHAAIPQQLEVGHQLDPQLAAAAFIAHREFETPTFDRPGEL